MNKTVNPRPTNHQTPTTKSRSVIDRIGPIGFGADEGIKLLLYGISGTGKTTLWATFPGPILAIVCSGGNRPGELRSIDTEEYRAKVQQVTLESSSEMNDLIPHAKKVGFKTVVLDHASGLQDMILKEILGIDEIPVAKTWGLASQQQYGQCTVQCKTVFRNILNLSANVVLVAHERHDKPGEESDVITPFVGPNLMPQLASWVNGSVDYILHTFIRPKMETVTTTIGTGKNAKEMSVSQRVKNKVEYVLRTAPDDRYAVKFRMPRGEEDKVPDVIVNANYDKIISVIRGI